ncbi:MAG: SCO family protein [Pedosphaera sp.]|nr:SCO family protein [Pedosphaera sp.]
MIERPQQHLIMAAVGFGIVLLIIAFLKQPVPTNVPPKSVTPLPVISQIQNFSLTNQAGISFTERDLAGKFWIADIVFTRCAGPCPDMTRRMAKLQKRISASKDVGLLTLTTDPENDSPTVMNAFAGAFGADTNSWTFLTGDKSQIARLAVDDLKLIAMEKNAAERTNPADLFIHSTLFVLIDPKGQVRGLAESEDSSHAEQLMDMIENLRKETAR